MVLLLIFVLFNSQMSRNTSFSQPEREMSRDTSFSRHERVMSRNASFADHGEILDGMVTRSRGEIRRTCSLKLSSCSVTSSGELKSIQSPRITDKVYSPRVGELRAEQSPRQGGRGPFSPVKPSNLGKSG